MGIEVTARILAHQYQAQYGSVPSDEFIQHASVSMGGSAAIQDAHEVLPADGQDFDARDARLSREGPGKVGTPTLDRAWEIIEGMTGRKDARASFEATAGDTYWNLLSRIAENRAAPSSPAP